MAESTAFPKPRDANDAGYQRISSFAVAGLVVGSLFVIFLLVQAVLGLLTHATVLLPLWFEFVALFGVALSLIGARSIRRSDGALGGTRIAQCGLWISLVTGLGYGAYYGATYLAIRQQAEAFTMEWFDKIRTGKINEAFLLTQPPGVRRDANPDDETYLNMRFNTPLQGAKGGPSKGGLLDQFRGNEIILMIRQGGEAGKVTPLGVSSWEHKEGTYVVRRVYGIELPEGSFNLQITAMGRDSPEASDKGRGWLISFMETSVEKDSLTKTKLGARIDAMRVEGKKFLTDWTQFLHAGALELAYAKTLDSKEEAAIKTRFDIRMYGEYLCAFAGADQGNVVKSICAGVPVDRNALRGFVFPGYAAAFEKAGVLDLSHLKSDDQAAVRAVEAALRNMLTSKGGSSFVVGGFFPSTTSTKSLWSLDNEKRVLLPLDCQIYVGPPGLNVKYFADTVVWLQSDPGQLETENTPRWRVTKMDVLRAGDVAALQPSSKRGAGPRN